MRKTSREPLRNRVAAAATNTLLAAANPRRFYIEIHNDSSSELRICEGDPATLTDYTHPVPPGGVWWPDDALYDGVINGIWSSASPSGAAQVVEYI